MATVIELLRRLGQGSAPDGRNALAGHVILPGVDLTPLALPGAPALGATWSKLVGRPTLRHHALAISAARTSHSVALIGHGDAPHNDLLLVALERLPKEQQTLLYIMPGPYTTMRNQLAMLASALGYSLIDAEQIGARIQPSALIIATPDTLHRRILRFHDRAWHWLWPRLTMIALPHLQCYNAAEAGHLHWLLRRVERLAAHMPLQLLAALALVNDVDTALAHVLERPIHTIETQTDPPFNTIIALWRCDSERAVTAIELGQQLATHRLPTTILGRDMLEAEQVRALLPADLSVGQSPNEARIAIVTGVPRSADARQALLRAGYRLLILLAGDEPHELLFATEPERLLSEAVYWPVAMANPYVSTCHIACAAAERPLEASEADRWNTQAFHQRLVEHNVLQTMPDEGLWQHAPDADDPYDIYDLATTGNLLPLVRGLYGSHMGRIPPLESGHCMLPEQMPASRMARPNDVQQLVQFELDSSAHATFVPAEITVRVHEELASRTAQIGVNAIELVKGILIAAQEIAELWEIQADGAQHHHAVSPPIQAQWSAVACWISLPMPPADPQTIGWALAQALPLLTLAQPYTLVPAYDAEHQRLYVIEAEPGDIGVAHIIYDHFEELIGLARRLAQACAKHSMYQYLARSESDWLEALPGPKSQKTQAKSQRSRAKGQRPKVKVQGQKRTTHRSSSKEDILAPSKVSESSATAMQPAGQLATEHATEAPAQPEGTEAKAATLMEVADAEQHEQSVAHLTTAEPGYDKPPPVGAVAQQPDIDSATTLPSRPAPQPTAGTESQQRTLSGAESEPAPDVSAMIARIRRMREEHQATQPQVQPRHDASLETMEPRFRSGERVQCLSYGTGSVRASRIVGGREHVLIDFDDYGEIEVDSSLSLIRHLSTRTINADSNMDSSDS